MNSINLDNKKSVFNWMNGIANTGIDKLQEKLYLAYHNDVLWRGSHPFNEIKGIAGVYEKFWLPLHTSFPDLERRDHVLVGGEYHKKWFVATMGHYTGTFRKTWLGIPATGKTIHLRYGEFYQVEEEKIIESIVLIDVLDFIRQAGYWPIAPSLGAEGRWMPPITGDGLVFAETDPTVSKKSFELIMAMHKSINTYDDDKDNTREGYLNMSQKEYWHPKMMWYGPSGIGTTRGLQGFVDHHQLPFRRAFPNRDGSGYYLQIADGKYAVTGGWPSVVGIHKGGDWLGTSATGRKIDMRVMDFYLTDEGLIRENWVPIDIIHILLQMGIDVFERLDYFINPDKYQ